MVIEVFELDRGKTGQALVFHEGPLEALAAHIAGKFHERDQFIEVILVDPARIDPVLLAPCLRKHMVDVDGIFEVCGEIDGFPRAKVTFPDAHEQRVETLVCRTVAGA